MTRKEIAVHTGNAAALAEGARQAPPLAISLFGPFEARRNGIPLPRLRTRKSYALLALLALRLGRPVERSWLAGTLWPESAEAQALANLRNSLKDLRRALGEEAGRLASPAPRSLRFELEGVAVDLLAFDQAIARGDAVALAEAAALYRGPLLEGWTEEWIFQERQARETQYLAALETLAERAMAQAKPEEAEQYLRRAVATDPLRESAQRGLMQALAAGGNYAGATRTYRDLRILLHRELNAEPDAETAALFHQLRAEVRRRALREKDLPRRHGDTENDARRGTRRKTARSSELSPCPSPCLRVSVVNNPPRAEHRGAATHNLPRQLTRFIGREREMREVKRLLSTAALLTVTGAGGCGKTRLALQVAPDLLPQYPDGVWLVELASLSDPALVAQTVASVLRVQEEPGRPLSETLAAYLQPRSLLLVLDNCEHLLAACAELADALLRGCPDMRILATSREVLGIAGEQAYRVPSLSLPATRAPREAWLRPVPGPLPSLERLLEFDAVRLFVDRAVLSQPTFAVTPANVAAVAEVCQRLDGIPLAIELAAARVKALSVEKLNARLDDMFRLLTGGSRTSLPRHQTLRALIDWSYDLLTESERALFRRLSVFAGGCTLEAAEAVCGELLIDDCRLMIEDRPVQSPISNQQSAISNLDILDLLTSLVEKSLVLYEERGREGRYRLLETVRQYARDRLLETGEAVVRRRHLGFFVRLAEQAEPELDGPEQAAWLDRLEREHDNLRAALAWSGVEGQEGVLCPRFGASGSERQRVERAGLRLGAALVRFWRVRGYWTEGREHLAGLLALPGAETHTAARGKALNAAGHLAERQGDYRTAWALHEESLAIFRELGHKSGIAWSLNLLGLVGVQRAEYGAARPLLEESLAIFRELGNKLGIAASLDQLGGLSGRERDDAAVRRVLFEECLAIHRELGNRQDIAGSLARLGIAAHDQGDSGAAQALFEESLAIFREVDHKDGMTWALGWLGIAACDQGDYEAARALWEESLAIVRELGHRNAIAWSFRGLARVAHGQGDNEKARALLEEARALWQELGHKGEESDACMESGHLLLELGDWAAARSCYEEGLALRRDVGVAPLVACALLEVGHAAWLQGEPGVTQTNAVEALALFEGLGHHEGILAALESLGVAAWAQGRKERAARLMGVVEAQREAPSLPGADWWRRPRERMGQAVRTALGEEAFAAAWAQGRTMSLEEATKDALDS